MPPLLVAAALHLCVAAAPPAPPHPAPERPASTRGAEPSDRADAGVPAEHRAQHALFQQKCAKCHALSIATSSHLTEAQLKRHLKRPGVALSPAQARAITEFLKVEAARRASR